MLLDGGKLKEVKIKLFLSSRAEMLRVIEQARQQSLTVQNIIHGSKAPPSQSTTSASTSVASSSSQSKLEDQKDEEDYKLKDEDGNRDKKDRYRSPSRERGRSKTSDSKDRSKESRDRSRGRHRDSRDNRRRRERSRSRDRYRSRRSRSRDRRRNSREKDAIPRNKQKLSDDDKNGPNSQDESSWDGSHQQKVPLLPDPPALPPMLLKMHSNGKDIIPPPAPVLNFPHDTERRPPFGYNQQMGPIPPTAYMPMRGREGWNPPQMVGVMDPLQAGLPRPMMNNVDMGMPGFPPFGINSPMFQATNPADPSGIWRPPLIKLSEDGKSEGENDLCVEIRGLPLNSSYIDVKKLFDGLSIPPDGIKMINDNQGNRTGIAYVRFSVPNHKKSALNQNGKKVRSNIVEVINLRDPIYRSAIDNFKPDKDVTLNSVDMDIDSGDNADDMWPRDNKRSRNKHHDPRMNKGNIDHDEKRTDCVILHGIPPHANENDILDFFDELGIIPIHTHVVFDNMGHPAGNAFCQFKSFEEAEKALSKNNAPLGRQIVSIKRARRDEMERARQIQQGGPMWQLQRPPLSIRNTGSVHTHSYGERLSEPERFRFDDRERYNHNERTNSAVDDRNPRYRHGENGGIPPLTRERGPMRGGRGPRGGGGGGIGLGAGNNEHYHHHPMQQHNRGGPPRRGAAQRERSPYIDDTTLENFGRPGCVVSLENLHFRAEIDEIINFFDGFNVEHENVIRRFDDNGRPTGDARVALTTPPDALRAVRILNFKMLRGRTVKVSLLQ